MTYRAIVIQNDTFLTEGYVWIRLDNDVNGINYDLHNDPDRTISNEIKSQWDPNTVDYAAGGCSRAYVASSFGGGEGYGMFTIPQINSRVLVSNIDNDVYSYVVIGSIFDNKAGQINLPKDDGINNPNIDKNERKIVDINGSLVISMKHTELADPLKAGASKDMLDWSKRPVENLLVLNRNGTILQHNILSGTESNGNLLFEMDADGASIDYQMGDDFLGRMMVAIDKEDKKPIIELSTMQGSNITQLKGRGKELDIMVSDGSTSSVINIKQNSVSINAADFGDITISSGGVVIHSTKAVSIQADNGVNIGSSTGYVVTYPTPGAALVLASGDSLQVSDKVMA